MKKVFVSLGLAASAAGLSSALGQGVEVASPKWWDASATLRGFYDDNYTVSETKQSSWGWEVSPTVSANMDLQQTDFGVRYTFGVYWYEQRSSEGENAYDYTHEGDVWLSHAFSETLRMKVTDSLVIAQDPALVQGGAVTRVEGNNLANHARITLDKDWTRQFSTSTHYQNSLFIYDDSSSPAANTPPGTDPSQAAMLNRMEQSIGNDFQWQFDPETMGFVGYTYTMVRYTGNAAIAPPPPTFTGPLTPYHSDSRDYNAHYVYVGAQHQFTPSISGVGKVGGSYVDNYNNQYGDSKSFAPYADLNLTYTYGPGCYLQGGYRQDIASTSEVAPGSNGELTQYQETSVFYFDVTHRITPKLSGTFISQYIYQSFKSGAYSGQPDNTVDLGANLTYAFNRHFSAEAGYNYDQLFSNVPGREYSRNRVYLGLTASY